MSTLRTKDGLTIALKADGTIASVHDTDGRALAFKAGAVPPARVLDGAEPVTSPSERDGLQALVAVREARETIRKNNRILAAEVPSPDVTLSQQAIALVVAEWVFAELDWGGAPPIHWYQKGTGRPGVYGYYDRQARNINLRDDLGAGLHDDELVRTVIHECIHADYHRRGPYTSDEVQHEEEATARRTDEMFARWKRAVEYTMREQVRRYTRQLQNAP